MSTETATCYRFPRPTRLEFHGGRWDGLVVEARTAHRLVIVSPFDAYHPDDDTGNFSLHGIDTMAPGRPPRGCYERRSSIVPPIHYHAIS